MKIMKKILLIILCFLGFVVLLDYISSYTTTHVSDVKIENDMIYLYTSSGGGSLGHVVESKLIEVEEGIYKVENKCNVLYGIDGANLISIDNSDGHIKEIRSYRNDVLTGYRIVYPIQDHEPWDIESITLTIYKNNELISSYQLDEEKFQDVTSKLADYTIPEYFLENEYIDVVKNLVYQISKRYYDGHYNNYQLFGGYLLEEKMDYYYKVNHYDDLINYLKEQFYIE